MEKGVKMGNIIWQSKITKGMVSELSDKEIEILIQELDDMVVRTCQDFGIEG